MSEVITREYYSADILMRLASEYNDHSKAIRLANTTNKEDWNDHEMQQVSNMLGYIEVVCHFYRRGRLISIDDMYEIWGLLILMMHDKGIPEYVRDRHCNTDYDKPGQGVFSNLRYVTAKLLRYVNQDRGAD